MSFIYRTISTGAIFSITEKDVLAMGPDYSVSEIENKSFNELYDAAIAVGAPALRCLTYDEVLGTFSWTIDFLALEMKIDGVLMGNSPLELDADASSTLLIEIAKKNLRDGSYQTGADDNNQIKLRVTRGLLRNTGDASNVDNVVLVNGVGSFRVKSVAETVNSRLELCDPSNEICTGFVQIKFV